MRDHCNNRAGLAVHTRIKPCGTDLLAATVADFTSLKSSTLKIYCSNGRKIQEKVAKIIKVSRVQDSGRLNASCIKLA